MTSLMIGHRASNFHAKLKWHRCIANYFVSVASGNVRFWRSANDEEDNKGNRRCNYLRSSVISYYYPVDEFRVQTYRTQFILTTHYTHSHPRHTSSIRETGIVVVSVLVYVCVVRCITYVSLCAPNKLIPFVVSLFITFVSTLSVTIESHSSVSA